MKNQLLLVCLAAALPAAAQPVLNSSAFPSVGMMFSDVQVDATALQQGNSGANQTWNFTGAVPNGTVLSREYLAPAGTPYASSFGAANICERSDDGAGGLTYLYYDHGSAQTDLLGFGWLLTGNPVTENYTNPQTLLAYPIMFNGTHSDTFAGSYSASISGLSYTDYRYGTYSYVADAYGSMTNPVGTYPNSLRLKIHQAITDSIVYTNPPLPPNLSYFNATTYNWMSADPQDRLNQFYISYDTISTIGTTTASKTAYYQDAATGMHEMPAPLKAGSFPNPASDHVVLGLAESVDGEAVLALYDLQGKVVMERTTHMRAAGYFEWMFPVGDLAPGLYQAVVRCRDKSWASRVVKR